ncbi:MAG: Mur ligase family protein [bacterium]|nr:Mur ligase family protein [bacterium]
MRFITETEAITYVFESLARTNWRERGLDEHTRDLNPSRKLLMATGLLESRREYAVVTGSKGKGSVTAITAKLLQSLGHTVGMVTSPHLTTYRQRFRVNGRMISEEDLVRIINELAPHIDAVNASLEDGRYLSPQGIFLAVALKWFDEQDVTVAMIEVGRGGRYDDNSLVNNRLSLFTPIILEHTRYLGKTLDRIAWHKAGIIKPHGIAYSLPQAPIVMDVLRREADAVEARFEWLANSDMGEYLGHATGDKVGMRVEMGRYGEVTIPMLGRYEIENASLAVWAAGNMHGRLKTEIKHGSPDYVERIRYGLEHVFWPGRCQKLQDSPAVFIDGAINPLSAKSFVDSVRDFLTDPVVAVLAVPFDRDLDGVGKIFAQISDTIILTQTDRNIAIPFPAPEMALGVVRQYHDNVHFAPTIAQAIDLAKEHATIHGTVLMSVAQPAIGDAMNYYDLHFEVI